MTKDAPKTSKSSSKCLFKESPRSKELSAPFTKESPAFLPKDSSKSFLMSKEIDKSSKYYKSSPTPSKRDCPSDERNHKSSDARRIESIDVKSIKALLKELESKESTRIAEVSRVKKEEHHEGITPKEDYNFVKAECEDEKLDYRSPKNDLKTSQKMKTFQHFRISENFGKTSSEVTPKTEDEKKVTAEDKLLVTPEEVPVQMEEEVTTSGEELYIIPKSRSKTPSPTDNEARKKKSSAKKVVQKPETVKKKLKKSLEKGAEYLQKVVESVKNNANVLKRKKNSDIKIIRRRNSLPHLSKADRKLQLNAIRDTLQESKIDVESAEKFESDSAIKLKNGLLKSLAEEDSSSGDKVKDSLLTRSYSTLVSCAELGDENAVDLLLESFQVKSKNRREKKEAAAKKKKVEREKEKEKTSDPLDDIEKFIAISENLLSKPENKENKDILVKKLFNDIKEFEANVKQESLAPPRRSHRLQTISKTVSKSSKGVVRNEKFSTEDYKLDLAELEAENVKFLKDMEERLTQFTVIGKSEYKCERIISKEAERMVCDCYLNPDEEDSGAFGCGEDCLNRLLMIECGDDCAIADRCTNKRFQKSMYSHCKVFRTEKKGFGIMAADYEINPGDFIMEYVGEVINTEQFEERRDEYSKYKNAHYYFMALRSDSIIDATTRGELVFFCSPLNFKDACLKY